MSCAVIFNNHITHPENIETLLRPVRSLYNRDKKL
jgi:hypothetical protein